MAEVTEKVILPKFDKEKYFKDGEIVYGKREEVEEAADKVCADGFKNIVLLGIGGTEFELAPIEYQVKKYSDIDINGHVNSIRYIEHILDLFPIDLYKTKRIRRFEMAYVAESYFGDELTFFCDEANENEFHVEVKKNGSEVVCRSKVIFE